MNRAIFSICSWMQLNWIAIWNGIGIRQCVWYGKRTCEISFIRLNNTHSTRWAMKCSKWNLISYSHTIFYGISNEKQIENNKLKQSLITPIKFHTAKQLISNCFDSNKAQNQWNLFEWKMFNQMMLPSQIFILINMTNANLSHWLDDTFTHMQPHEINTIRV